MNACQPVNLPSNAAVTGSRFVSRQHTEKYRFYERELFLVLKALEEEEDEQ